MVLNTAPTTPLRTATSLTSASFSRLPPELKTSIAIALPNDRDVVNLSRVDRHTHGALEYLVSTIRVGREIPQLASTEDFQEMLTKIQATHPRWHQEFIARLFERLSYPHNKMLPETFALLMQHLEKAPAGRPAPVHRQKIFKLLGRAFIQIPSPQRESIAPGLMALLRGNRTARFSDFELPRIQENYEAMTAAISGMAPGEQKTWTEQMPIPDFPLTPRAEKATAIVELLKTNDRLHAAARQIQLEKMEWAVYALPDKDRPPVRELLKARNQP